MHVSISLILYTDSHGLSPVLSAKMHSLNVSEPEIAKKITKNPLFFHFNVVQGHRCWYPPP